MFRQTPVPAAVSPDVLDPSAFSPKATAASESEKKGSHELNHALVTTIVASPAAQNTGMTMRMTITLCLTSQVLETRSGGRNGQ